MSDMFSKMWIVAVALGTLAWFNTDLREVATYALWVTVPVALVCGLFAGMLPVRSRPELVVASAGLLVLCCAIAVLGDFLVYGEGRRPYNLHAGIIGGLVMILLPVMATVAAIIWDFGTSAGAFRGFQLAVLTIVLTPWSILLTAMAAAFVFGEGP